VSYTAPAGNAVELVFSGAYAAPVGNAVLLDFDPPPPNTSTAEIFATLEDVAGSVLTIALAPSVISGVLEDVSGAVAAVAQVPVSIAATLDDVSGLILIRSVSIVSIESALGDVSATIEASWTSGVWRGLMASRALPHAEGSARQHRQITGVLKQAARTPAQLQTVWDAADTRSAARGEAWGQVPIRHAARTAGWDKVPVRHRSATGSYRASPRRAQNAAAVWQSALTVEHARAERYRSPPRRAFAAAIAQDQATARAIELFADYGVADPVFWQRFTAPWGVANPHSWIWGGWFYPPPPPAPLYQPSTDLVFYQRQEDYTGGAILEFNRPCWAWPLSDPRTTITAGAIIVLHTITVVRLPDLVNVPVLAVSLQFDIDSWAWGVSLNLQTPEAIALLEPVDGEPQQVRIDLNGILFTALIESWSETWQFGETLYTASGRSPLAIFAAPYAPLRSYLEPDPQTAAQLIDRELANTGWSIAYHPDLVQLFTTDWLVPGGTWSYQNKSPLDAIRQIAAAAGARAFADRNNAVLHIQPRYSVSPWDWSAATPDKTIPIGLARSVSTQLVPRPDYDQVYVSGQNQGVLVNAIRQGSAGGNPAPMITDPLITYVNAGRERARNALSDTGRQARVSLDLPLSQITGLIEPGQLTEVSEATPWRGLAVGLTINAVHGAISQRIEIERHYS
jgi:hypothetical protein